MKRAIKPLTILLARNQVFSIHRLHGIEFYNTISRDFEFKQLHILLNFILRTSVITRDIVQQNHTIPGLSVHV